MRVFSKLFILLGVLSVAGCSAVSSEIRSYDTVYPMAGTNAAVVGIGVNKQGIPFVAAKEIIVKPGQNIIFAGPDEFVVAFKNKKSPNRKIDNPSKDGVVRIQVPSKIFEQREFVEEYRKNGQLRFSYGVIVNGKELDPDIIIKRH